MIPVVAAQFVEDWRWGGGFVRAQVLFFLTGMAIVLIARPEAAECQKLATLKGEWSSLSGFR